MGKEKKQIYLGISRFWTPGISVRGIYRDHGMPDGLSYEGLTLAKNDRLGKVSAAGLLALLNIASDLAGRPVDAREILVEVEK